MKYFAIDEPDNSGMLSNMIDRIENIVHFVI